MDLKLTLQTKKQQKKKKKEKEKKNTEKAITYLGSFNFRTPLN